MRCVQVLVGEGKMVLSQLRVFGYTVTILLHVGHLLYLALQPQMMDNPDPQLRTYGELRRRFFTCWNFYLQVIYAISGLICEYLESKNSSKKNYELPKHLRGFRDTLFAGIVWPATWLVFTVFWSLFLYNRELIFPAYVDAVLSPTSNHIMHTAIVPIVLWEVLFRQRRVPRSHVWNLGHLTFYMALYVSVMIYTYFERGVWLYPIFKILYGTIFFPIVCLGIYGLTIVFYYSQWFITRLIYSQDQAKSKPKKKVK